MTYLVDVLQSFALLYLAGSIRNSRAIVALARAIEAFGRAYGGGSK